MRSSVDSEVDLLKDYKPRSPIEENKDKEVKCLSRIRKSYQNKLSKSLIIEDHDSIENLTQFIHHTRSHSESIREILQILCWHYHICSESV